MSPLEESLAEAVATTSIYLYAQNNIKHENISLDEALEWVEDDYEEDEKYASQIGAKLLREKRWRETISKLLNFRENPAEAYNALKNKLGDNFSEFISGINLLYRAEIGANTQLSKDEIEDLFFDLSDIIEKKEPDFRPAQRLTATS